MMYPRNAANPERIAIGAVVQISDGVVQTTGVSVSVQPQGGSESAGGGTLAFNTGGEALYTPTQAETNYTSFIVTAYKTGCFPISQTVVTTANATPGRVDVGSVVGTAQDGVNLGAGITDIKGTNFSATTDTLEKIRDRLDTVGSSASSPAADKAYALAWTRVVGDDDGGGSGDAATVNGVSFVTGETTGTTLLEVNGTVTVDDPLEMPMAIKFWVQYTGTGSHYLNVRAYNYTDSTWEPVGVITNTSEIAPFTFGLSPQHINRTTGQVQIKVIHTVAAGNPAHYFAIDKGLLLMSSAVEALTVDNISHGVWDELISPSHHNVKNSAAYKLWRHADTMIHTGVAQGPGSLGVHNQIQLDTGASSVDGAYDPALVVIVAGTGAGQSRNILQYVGATRMATVDRSWKVDPAADSEFIIVTDAGREHVNEGLAQGGGVQTITLNPQASDHDDAYNAQVVFLRSGPGEDQARRILDYEGATRIATVSRPWTTGHEPTSSTAYVVLPTGAISDNCIGRAVWSDQIGDYAAIPGSSAEALIAARDNASLGAQTISEGLFALFQGCKDWGPIISASFTGTFQPGGYLEVRYTIGTIGSGGGDYIGSFDENGTWTTDPGYNAFNSKNAVLRVDAGNVATAGILTINYVSLLDNAEHRWVSRVPAIIDWDECWNLREDGRLRPCDAGVMPRSFSNEEYYRCDGWSWETDPLFTISNSGPLMDQALEHKYCIQFICLDDPTFAERMLGYWSTWGGWQHEMGQNVIVPPNSIMTFCPDNAGPNEGSIPARMLEITPQSPGGLNYGKMFRLYVGEMTHEHGSGTKYAFGADGVMKAINLFPSTSTGGGGGATEEQIEALITVLGQLTSHQYHPGTIVNPVEAQSKDLTLFANTDYDDMIFNVGAQWATYLNEQNAEVWFTVLSDKGVRLIDVQGAISDPNLGTLLLDLTAAQTNVKVGTHSWQFMLRRSITTGTPPNEVTVVKRRMMMDGKVYMKPSFKA